ncbi:hypothetical protein BY996DRAFT_8534141 [Phakopsora pachyrhizi]|uniref:Uncharacterized protein n=1 Tax=Phakopsora pachyrhizi TaxID=170000 RepID=A0AAV0AH57_PHAPC|nr:hypothetical protein BY996DRAFT_8534141 [Phakopsora pachyrhizi]CAH7666826.1 hypothetical protein PPACK8108_LOCUS1183 [Phakopsora pachyrhizi]
MVNLDIMHNLILGALKDHATHKLRIPEVTWKHSYHEILTHNSSEALNSDSEYEVISKREVLDLKKNSMKRSQTQDLRSTADPSFTPKVLHHSSYPGIPTSVITERYDDEDLNYIPLTDSDSNDSDIDLNEIQKFQIHGPRLGLLREIIKQKSIPKNIGAASHGNLKAAEWSIQIQPYRSTCKDPSGTAELKAWPLLPPEWPQGLLHQGPEAPPVIKKF